MTRDHARGIDRIGVNHMETRQKEIFEGIHDGYYASTGDEYARAYKDRYIMQHIRHYVGDAGTMIELACGQGEASAMLKRCNPALEVSGCDISERAAADYRSVHRRPCMVADLTKPFAQSETYDAVVVMGGIHHLLADLTTAFDNISKLLEPGGRLIMVEPSADFFLNPVRRLWYKLDKDNFDSESEEALCHDDLFARHGRGFRQVGVQYLGGPAYFLLTLNMFLRVPQSSKRLTAPALMGLERLYTGLPTRRPFAFFIACWEKTG